MCFAVTLVFFCGTLFFFIVVGINGQNRLRWLIEYGPSNGDVMVKVCTFKLDLLYFMLIQVLKKIK